MIVSLADISCAFDDLISGDRSREDIAGWASLVERAEDSGHLEYDPCTEEERIWDAIDYLTGVDLLTIPSGYLHDIKNFQDYRREAGV